MAAAEAFDEPLFRDWFRAHPEAVPAYARFKLALTDAVRDIEVYTDVKDRSWTWSSRWPRLGRRKPAGQPR
jgi:GrpB-like predicted nucleotidyltransferase (UPF0157 family)